jgi:3-oxoacyl-[acyl-carrier protein] reductase
MSHHIDLSGRVALVTGASRGIGRAIALALGGAGAAAAVNYRERALEADEVVDKVGGAGGRAIAVGADVSVRRAVADMVARIEAKLGPVDILVNNAGVARA